MLLIIVIFILLRGCFSFYCPSYCDDIPPDLPQMHLECDLIQATGQCNRTEILEQKFCRCSCQTCPVPPKNQTTTPPIPRYTKSKVALRMQEIEKMNQDMNTVIEYNRVNLSEQGYYENFGRSVEILEEFAPIQGPCSCYDEPPVGSTYTCLEMYLDGKCDVLLEYGFCECTCGKCAGRQQIFDNDQYYPETIQNSTSQSMEITQDTLQADALITEDSTQNMQTQIEQQQVYQIYTDIDVTLMDQNNEQNNSIVDIVSNKEEQLSDDYYEEDPANMLLLNFGQNQSLINITNVQTSEVVLGSQFGGDSAVNDASIENNQTLPIDSLNEVQIETIDPTPPQNSSKFQSVSFNQSNFDLQVVFEPILIPQVEVEYEEEQLDNFDQNLLDTNNVANATAQNFTQNDAKINNQQHQEEIQIAQLQSPKNRAPSSRFFESSSYEDVIYDQQSTFILPPQSSIDMLTPQTLMLAQSPPQLLPIAIQQPQLNYQQQIQNIDNNIIIDDLMPIWNNNCVDIEPPNLSIRCSQLKQQGRCSQKWMEGYCELSCGVCSNDNNNIDYNNINNNINNGNPLFIDQQNNIDNFGVDLQNIGVSTNLQSQPPLLPQIENVPQNSVCLSACNDNPPTKSDFSCGQQKSMGKCDRDWMKGYCECTCETCDAYFHTKDEFPKQSQNFTSITNFQTPIWSTQTNTQTLEDNYFLTVLHFNDIHARVEPTTEWWWECEPWRNEQGECFGGFARMKSVIDLERQIDPDLLLLDGGDDFVGSQWDYHDPANKATAYFLSLMGVDAMTLGNHEFDHGPDVLIEHIQEAQYPILSCNMDASKKPSLEQITQKYVIKEVKGRKIGILGLTTTYTNTAEAANPYPVWFDEPYQAARECIKELQQKNVDIIIALSHLGYSADRYLVREVNGLDLVIGAHSHSFLSNELDVPELNLISGKKDEPLGTYPTWEQSPDGTNVPVVQAGWATRYMGKIQIRFNKNGQVIAAQGQPILLGGSQSGNQIIEDQQFVQEIQKWKWW